MLAYSEIGKRNGLNSTDAFVATTPLILIPVMAAIILIRSFLKLPSRQILVMLPFLLLLFFLTIIIDSEVKEVTGLSGFAFFPETQIGFYLMLLASLLLPFTKNYRGKRTRKWRTPETEIAV